MIHALTRTTSTRDYGGLVLVFYVIYNFIKNMNKVENERKNENTKVK